MFISENKNIVFHHGDAIEKMKLIPDKSVNMVLTDLPYGTTRAKWDTPIDLKEMWNQFDRICKDDAAILLFAQTPFDKVLGTSNLKHLKYEWIWEKTQATGFFNAKKAPMKCHENILVFYKKNPKYNFQKTEGHKPVNSYTKRIDVVNKTELYGKVNKEVSGGGETDRYPRSILKFKSDKQVNKSKGIIHPNQKPLALCEYFVKTYSDENDLVLDCTMGSATTGVACRNLNRKFIGIEKEEKWFNVSIKRIIEF